MVYRLKNLLLHDSLNLLKANRGKIVAVHPNVNSSCVGVIWKSAVTMSVKIPSTIMTLVPNPHRVMAQNYFLSLALDFAVTVRMRVEFVAVLPRQPVVISFDENFASFELIEISVEGVFVPAEAEVSQVIY